MQTKEKDTKKKGCRLHLAGYRLDCEAKAQKLASLRQSALFDASQSRRLNACSDEAGGCAVEELSQAASPKPSP